MICFRCTTRKKVIWFKWLIHTWTQYIIVIWILFCRIVLMHSFSVQCVLFIFNKFFILARVTLGTRVRGDYTLDRTLGDYSTWHRAHIHTVIGRWEETKWKPKGTWREHAKLCINSNPSSGSNPRAVKQPCFYSTPFMSKHEHSTDKCMWLVVKKLKVNKKNKVKVFCIVLIIQSIWQNNFHNHMR